MAIGTSQGAFYEDQFHYSQSQWDPKYDDNEITPNKQRTDKALEGAEVDPSTGLGIDVNNTTGENSPSGNLGATGRAWNNKKEEDTESLRKGLDDWDAKSKQFREELHNRGLMTPELEEIYNRRFGPYKPTPKESDGPMSSLGTDALRVAYKTASPLVTITDEDIDKAMSIGMAAGPGTMAGVASKTANVASRLKAAVMEGKGEHPETIRQETGWSKGSDGRARYEISDEGMKLVDKDWKFGETGKLPDFIEHPDLYKAYPHLKDMNFEVAGKDFPYIGGFNSLTNTIHVNPSAIKSGDEGILDVISHELQHAVQTKEGFTGGSNPNVMFDKITQALRGKILDNVKDMESMKPLMRLYKDIHENARKFTDFMYESVPGEVESNLTMNRRKLTTQQRKEFSPEDTQKMLEGQYNGISGGKYRAPIDLSDVM